MQKFTTKSLLLRALYDAKYSHKEWVRKAERLVNGLSKNIEWVVDKDFIPLDSAACTLGSWIKANYGLFSHMEIGGNDIDMIDEYHVNLHEIYAEIYAIYFISPTQRSLLHKVFTLNNKSVSNKEREKARIHLSYLKKVSSALLEALDKLEEKIQSLEYTDLQKLTAD